MVTLTVLVPVFLSVRLSNDTFVMSLNERARVLYPSSEDFANASLRWSAANSPAYSLIVQVATEADIQKTVNTRLLI